MPRIRTVALALAIGVSTVIGLGACGGGGSSSSPADTITQPIDKAKTVANDANQREQQVNGTMPTEP